LGGEPIGQVVAEDEPRGKLLQRILGLDQVADDGLGGGAEQRAAQRTEDELVLGQDDSEVACRESKSMLGAEPVLVHDEHWQAALENGRQKHQPPGPAVVQEETGDLSDSPVHQPESSLQWIDWDETLVYFIGTNQRGDLPRAVREGRDQPREAQTCCYGRRREV
ncbi:hypothetical protein B484DRAFT_437341, partial [Ochromonadaceae sp. CCMP2298]